MDAIRRTTTLRRVATTASLAALLLTPGAADAKKKPKPKSPVITSVSPMSAVVGDTLTIRGKNFRKGKGKNSVGFKRDGQAVVFVKAGVSTTRVMAVKIPSRLEKVLDDGTPAPFHLRILAKRFGKAFTPTKLSPIIAPKPVEDTPGPTDPTDPTNPTPTATAAPTVTVAPTAPTCIATKSDSVDSDGDLLSDALENKIGTAGCDADSDDDDVTDGYEYRSAIDLNDDEYQQPNTAIPYPGARPYPNPLNKDSDKDYDGDGLSMSVEFSLTVKYSNLQSLVPTGNQATPLLYSDGLQYSASRYCGANETDPDANNPNLCGTGSTHQNRRVPTLRAAGYAKWDGTEGTVNGVDKDGFYTWAQKNGFGTVGIHQPMRTINTLPSDPACPWYDQSHCRKSYDIRNVNLDNATDARETNPDDLDGDKYLSDNERDEDADGLTNYAEFVGYMQPAYWTSCYAKETPYPIVFAGTDPTNPDSDGDGIRDGADDQDHDDVPNLMEQSRRKALNPYDANSPDVSAPVCDPPDDLSETLHKTAYGRVNPFNPCLPDTGSRNCPTVNGNYAPFGDAPNWWALQ